MPKPAHLPECAWGGRVGSAPELTLALPLPPSPTGGGSGRQVGPMSTAVVDVSCAWGFHSDPEPSHSLCLLSPARVCGGVAFRCWVSLCRQPARAATFYGAHWRHWRLQAPLLPVSHRRTHLIRLPLGCMCRAEGVHTVLFFCTQDVERTAKTGARVLATSLDWGCSQGQD